MIFKSHYRLVLLVVELHIKGRQWGTGEKGLGGICEGWAWRDASVRRNILTYLYFNSPLHHESFSNKLRHI